MPKSKSAPCDRPIVSHRWPPPQESSSAINSVDSNGLGSVWPCYHSSRSFSRCAGPGVQQPHELGVLSGANRIAKIPMAEKSALKQGGKQALVNARIDADLLGLALPLPLTRLRGDSQQVAREQLGHLEDGGGAEPRRNRLRRVPQARKNSQPSPPPVRGARPATTDGKNPARMCSWCSRRCRLERRQEEAGTRGDGRCSIISPRALLIPLASFWWWW